MLIQREKASLSFLFLSFIFLASACFGYGLPVGSPAPAFKVTSGDNDAMTIDNLKGKVIIIFYESKDTVEKNRPLKEALNQLYAKLPAPAQASIVRLPVIDCTEARWLTTGFWKNSLVSASKKEGIKIYGDWDGKMLSAYQMKENDSNFMIIDRKGIVRYFTFGTIPSREVQKIKNSFK